MDYTQIKRRYMRFLRLERNYTQNTIDAYSHDIDYLINFLNGEHLAIEEVRLSHLEQFATILHEFGVAPSSQARILCGVRSFSVFFYSTARSKTTRRSFLSRQRSANTFHKYFLQKR